MTNNHRTVSSVACQLVRSFSQQSCCFGLRHCYSHCYSRTAARNQLNCRGSRPHSRMTHHEAVVSLTIRILLSTVISHFCKGLSISLPYRKDSVAQTWLAYILAGIAYVLRSHMQMCNLFVRSCSRTNCLMRRVPAVNELSAASAAVFKLICLSQTMPRFLQDSV